MQIIERVDIDDDEGIFEAIDKLISQGIKAGDVNKLQEAGIYTCNGLMMQTKKHLTGIQGLSEAKVDKICEDVEKFVNLGYVTGSDVLLRRKSVIRVTTGSQALDELLGGGNETSCITEAFGEFRSGKTQLARTLCVSTQLPINMRGGNGKVAYIDTEGTSRSDRIVPITERFGMDADAVLDNVIYARAYTYEHQHNLLLGLAEEPSRLLILDSIIALFGVHFTGRDESLIKGLGEAMAAKIREAAENVGCASGGEVLLRIRASVLFAVMMLLFPQSNNLDILPTPQPTYKTLAEKPRKNTLNVHYLLVKAPTSSMATVYGVQDGIPLRYGNVQLLDWANFQLVFSNQTEWCLMINSEFKLIFVNLQERSMLEAEAFPFQADESPNLVGGCFHGDPIGSHVIALIVNISVEGRSINSLRYLSEERSWLKYNLDEGGCEFMSAPFIVNDALFWISQGCIVEKLDMALNHSRFFVEHLLGTESATIVMHNEDLYVVAQKSSGRSRTVAVRLNPLSLTRYDHVFTFPFSVFAISNGVGYATEELNGSIFRPCFREITWL